MGTVRYTVIDGEIIAEKRNGVRKQYVPDSLGSTVALLDNTQMPTDTFTYWPYGEVASRTGTTPTPFQFVGTAGYRQDRASKTYVRARYLDTQQGRWLTEDPLGEKGDLNLYAYTLECPTSHIDPSGLLTVIVDPSCHKPPYSGHGIVRKVRQLCSKLLRNPSCGQICGDWKHTYQCLKKQCSSTVVIHCLTDKQCNCNCPLQPGKKCGCSVTPGGSVGLCPSGATQPGGCGCLQNTILHEMVHNCGQTGESAPCCIANYCTFDLPECPDYRKIRPHCG